MNATTTVLRELHRIHTQLADLRDRLERGPKQIRARETNIKHLEAELATAEQATKQARIDADMKQLQLKEGEVRNEDLKRKLNTANSNREYQALQEQIAADEMANSVLADEILESLERIDTLTATAAQIGDNLAKSREEAAKIRREVQEQQETLESEVARVSANLAESESRLPAEIRPDYDRIMKSKGSDGMAPLEGECCGGCYRQLPPNTFNALALGRIVFCGTCGRLLYPPEDYQPKRK